MYYTSPDERSFADLMQLPIFSTVQAAELLGQKHTRIQTWLNDGVVPFHTLEQGPRRLLRKFDGWQLLSVAMMVELIDTYGLSVDRAKDVSVPLNAAAPFHLFSREHPEVASDFDPNHAPRGHCYVMGGGCFSPCFAVDTIDEARERIGNPEMFIVFDAAPMMVRSLNRVCDAIRDALKSRLDSLETKQAVPNG